jgi:hypothetical protein
MLCLYKVLFIHYSPKDNQEGIQEFVLAESEEAVCDYVDTTHNYGSWAEHEEPYEEFDDNTGDSLGEIPYREKVLKERGEWFEEVSDLYYGATQWGWSEPQSISEEDAEKLIALGIAKRIGP